MSMTWNCVVPTLIPKVSLLTDPIPLLRVAFVPILTFVAAVVLLFLLLFFVFFVQLLPKDDIGGYRAISGEGA